jgi:hypothetical protein
MTIIQINYLYIQLHYPHTSHLVSVYIRDSNIIREVVVLFVPFPLSKLGNEEIVDGLVSDRVSVLEVEAMSGTRDDESGDVGAGESLLGLSRNTAAVGCTVEAAATAEWHITLASDNVDWASEVVEGSSLATDGEQLANSHGLAGCSGESENLWVKVAR